MSIKPAFMLYVMGKEWMMLSPDRCQRSGTEEGIHPTLQLSQSCHVNTAEKTCNRGWDEQSLAGWRGVPTRQDYTHRAQNPSPLSHNIHPDNNGQQLLWSKPVFVCLGLLKLHRTYYLNLPIPLFWKSLQVILGSNVVYMISYNYFYMALGP